tara:strand:- start:2999 stop:4132 length:1134 start_codon:yes stop_codon:yes gene_type:complete
MRYCKRCIIPNTRPNGSFDESGICLPCQFSLKSNSVDYEERFEELKAIVRKLTARNRKKKWQCLIGISGGKDSTRQALWVRDKLGLDPLLVSVVYPPRQVSENGVDNISNLISLGFDVYILSAAPRLSRELMKESFFRFGNIVKATEMALFSGVPRVAFQKGIPLILWGENPALYVGDSATLGSSMWDGSNLINSNTLQGGNLDWFIEVSGNKNLLPMYKFPSKANLEKSKIKTIFLGPAWPDWSADHSSRVSISYGLNIRGGDAKITGDRLGTRQLDEDWFIVNMLIKFYKFGFARATEEANIAIRENKITREQGIKIAEDYDEACGDEYIESFCKYISISKDEFWENVMKFTNKELFDCSGKRPKKLFKVGKGIR